MSYSELAQRLGRKLVGARLDEGDSILVVPCPIENHDTYIEVFARAEGDAVWCKGDCEPAEVESTLRYLAARLPDACGDPRAQGRDAYSHRQTCPRCARYDPAFREAFKAVNRGEALVLDHSDGSDGWAPVNLLEAESLSAPSLLDVPGTGPIIRRGWITLVHGLPASGKTPLCYLAAVEAVQAGGQVLLIDYEMGAAQARHLLRELGLTDDEITEGVYYVYGPPPLTSTSRRSVVEEVERRQAATSRELVLTVTDSLTESMAMLPGASDNDAQDVTTWASSHLKWLRDQFPSQPAVLVIDHSGNNDGKRPSGSHKKREVVQFHLWVVNKTPFSKAHERGWSEISVQKDRSGERQIGATIAELHTRAGDSFYLAAPRGTSTSSSPGTVTVPLDLQPDQSTDADVLDDLVAAGLDGMSKTELCGAGARGQYRRAAFGRLLDAKKAVEVKNGRVSRCFASEFAP